MIGSTDARELSGQTKQGRNGGQECGTVQKELANSCPWAVFPRVKQIEKEKN